MLGGCSWLYTCVQAASSAVSIAKSSGISIPSGASVDPVSGPPVPGLPPVAPTGRQLADTSLHAIISAMFAQRGGPPVL